MAVSFQKDIEPIFAPYRENMAWRFDITDYETVKANAKLIYGRITAPPATPQMPPPQFAPLTKEQQELFHQWMEDGFPP